MTRRSHIAAVIGSLAIALAGATAAYGEALPPGSEGTPPPATPEGCHGFYTVAYKQLTGDPAQGPAIVGQTQTPAGRGGTLQAFLAAFCGVGSEAP